MAIEPELVRDQTIMVRLTKNEKQDLQRVAKAFRSRSISDFVRALIQKNVVEYSQSPSAKDLTPNANPSRSPHRRP